MINIPYKIIGTDLQIIKYPGLIHTTSILRQLKRQDDLNVKE